MKVIKTGNIIEIYEYEKEKARYEDTRMEITEPDYWVPTSYELNRLELQEELDEYYKEQPKATKEENREHNIKQIRLRIKRLINANFDHSSIMATFTFRENLQDIPQANKLYKEFIQRLRYTKGKDFKYLAIIEFQERGAIHYHTLINLKYIPQQELITIWQNGGVDVRKVEKVDNLGAYLSIYLTKENSERLMGKKAYLSSRNLDKPETYYTDSIELDELTLVYQKRYSTEFNGICHYKEFNCNRGRI